MSITLVDRVAKNAYYNDSKQLETLPNIDINIKVGNSLLSRFSLDEDLKNSLKRRKLTLAQYRDAVDSYKNAKTKDQKYQMEQLISDVKNDFCTEIFYHDPKAIKLANLKAEITLLELPQTLLDELINEKEAREKKQQKLSKNNKAYENSFEWRFEFPEILDDKGCFQGFDVIVGNPPYGVSVTGESRKALVKSLGKVPDFEIYYWFINLGKKILRKNGQLSFIIPNTLLFNVFAQAYRLEMLKNWTFEEVVDCTDFVVFSDASVRNVVIRCSNNSDGNRFGYRETSKAKSLMEIFERPLLHVDSSVAKENNSNWGLIFKSSADVAALVAKIKRQSTPLQTYFPETSQGLIAYDKHAGQSDDLIKKRVFHSTVMHSQDYKPWLYGEDVRRYSVAWNAKEYINCSGNIANPRKSIYFSGKRVLIREITNPGIYAGYTQDELYFDPSVIVVMDSLNCNFTLYSLLGILNSKLATFFHFNSSPKATKGTFPKILVYDINNFPLPRDLSSGICLLIDGKVSEILKMRNVDSSSDTSALEDEVNRLVYQLYGLTPQEISTVEGTEVTTLDCV
ncbi:MAG: Eco57I restriction-modification methylase domain-containing protein [Dechloromonas sp.]|uniref:site-specific DNA-methyltransferase (adenine-specific) n=1 Tax=Candidatus Dechloromonas phosphorivorans TaxID=2899244 RepID=A0A935KBP5_9RHOO|nr:Eco57I restriction-modification methylase domain-containing protein [Candidatus Dechloromonas phosphorivorans]